MSCHFALVIRAAGGGEGLKFLTLGRFSLCTCMTGTSHHSRKKSVSMISGNNPAETSKLVAF